MGRQERRKQPYFRQKEGLFRTHGCIVVLFSGNFKSLFLGEMLCVRQSVQKT